MKDWEGTGSSLFNAVFWHLSGRTEENHDKSHRHSRFPDTLTRSMSGSHQTSALI
jgi:hypothetical protein